MYTLINRFEFTVQECPIGKNQKKLKLIIVLYTLQDLFIIKKVVRVIYHIYKVHVKKENISYRVDHTIIQCVKKIHAKMDVSSRFCMF